MGVSTWQQLLTGKYCLAFIRAATYPVAYCLPEHVKENPSIVSEVLYRNVPTYPVSGSLRTRLPRILNRRLSSEAEVEEQHICTSTLMS